MNLPRAAVARPVLTTMVFVGLIVLGAVAFTRLQIDLLPEIDFPSVSVTTNYDGAGPEEIETLITRPIEQRVSTLEGIQEIESSSMEGRSRVSLEFEWGTNLDSALNDVRAEVEQVKDRLPEEADPPAVHKFNLGSFPVIHLGLSGSIDEPALRQLAEQDLGPRLERIEGVAQTEVRGGLKREIHVLLDTERLEALRIAPATVVEAIRQQNRNVPSGQIEQYDENLLLRSIGEAEQVEDFQSVVVDVRGGEDGPRQPVFLDDVARVVDTYEEPENVVRVNGEPGIRISVSKQSGANTVAVADRVVDALDDINRDYQGRAKLTVLEDTSTYIENSISNVRDSVLVGALLAVFVLLFFLRDVRSTAIVAAAIPTSMIGIFTLMYYFDITLNLISFGGVALGIGLLVDNAIVILENIFRKLEEGVEPDRAAIEGSGEVAGAIVASTTTTLVVFVPVIFLTGFASIFFGQMAFVVSFALVCSLAVALTLVPMLSARFLKPQANKFGDDTGPIGRFLAAIEQAYTNLINWCLAHPKSTLLGAVMLLGTSLTLLPLIGTELIPEDDQSEVGINLEMPVGTRIETTEKAARKIEERLPEVVPELRTIRTVVGTPGSWSTDGEESASIELKLVRPHERDRSSEEIAREVHKEIQGIVPGAEVHARAGGGLWLQGGGERLELQVRGHELDTSDELASKLKGMMEETDGIASAEMSRRPGSEEVHVRPDRHKLASIGVEPSAVTDQIQTYVQGTRASVYRAMGDEFDVLVRLPHDRREDIDEVLDTPLIIPEVGAVPLGELVEVERTEGPQTIEREGQRRIVTLSAVISGERDLGSVAADLRGQVRDMEVPDGFSVIVTGETEEQEETFGGLLIGLFLAIALVYMVMASQFESFLQPLYIMFAIPFAAIGVLVMLAATGTTFNLQSFLGCIVLVGIVVNNAIVLIDYINLMRKRGKSVTEAVTVSARRRLRPILMTTATTLLALTPIALGVGEGGDTQAPLARAVIGGLLVSAAISLVVIPVIYNSVESWRAQREKRS